MARAATARLKCNPPLGRMPVLQFLRPDELQVDPAYQRSLETSASQALIRKIAQHWNWDLCQPLVVARRKVPASSSEAIGGKGASGSEAVGERDQLFVIDGQHRLEAARMRGDIDQLPGVVVEYGCAADEAASFVHLNQQRRPLGKLDLFKAALASEDPEAQAIMAAIDAAGLSVAPHSNFTAWKPGMVSNIGGIEAAWRKHGAAATTAALRVLAKAFAGEVLRYAGTIFPGIAAVCAEHGEGLDEASLANLIGSASQVKWRGRVMSRKASDPGLRFAAASAAVVGEAWQFRQTGVAPVRELVAAAPAPRAIERPSVPAMPSEPCGIDKYDLRNKAGAQWCEQCEKLRTPAQVGACTSRFCKLGVAG